MNKEVKKELKKFLKFVVAIEVIAVLVTTILNTFWYFAINQEWNWAMYPIMCGIVAGCLILTFIVYPFMQWWMSDKSEEKES